MTLHARGRQVFPFCPDAPAGRKNYRDGSGRGTWPIKSGCPAGCGRGIRSLVTWLGSGQAAAEKVRVTLSRLPQYQSELGCAPMTRGVPLGGATVPTV
jgi:hypothetical protein